MTRLRYAILGADLLWIVCAFLLAQAMASSSGSGATHVSTLVFPPILATVLVWVVLYLTKKLECFSRGWYLPSVLAQVTVAVGYLIGVLMAVAFCAKYYYPRLDLLYVGCLLPLGFVSIRCCAWRLVTSRSAWRGKRRVVILGVGRTAQELTYKIALHPETSMEVAGVLFPSDSEPAKQIAVAAPKPISLRSLNIVNLLLDKGIQDLIVVEPAPQGPETEKLISSCRKAGMRIHLVPQHYELYLSRTALTEIDSVPLLSIEEHKLPAVGMKTKKGIDLAGSLLLLAVSAPLLAVFAAALYWKRGKAFRKEQRCGKEGVPFWMYRLNIDRAGEHLRGYEWILARFSLTELPQLWNVLRGEMSLVGPRPESHDRVRHYSMWQRQRLNVRPGLTGLAQVHGLREQHSSDEKAQFDLQYIRQWSLFLDLSLLLQTAWALFVRLLKEDCFRTVLQPKKPRKCSAPGVMHADRAQSGAD